MVYERYVGEDWSVLAVVGSEAASGGGEAQRFATFPIPVS
jgi:hypothetical protein